MHTLTRVTLVALGVSLAACADLVPLESNAGRVRVLPGEPPMQPTQPSMPADEPLLQPLMGGSLHVANGHAYATDPDTGTLFDVDLAPMVVRSLELPAGSVPTRSLALDGRVLVLLKATGKVAVVTTSGEALALERTFDVCGEPRGLSASDVATEALVACATGELVRVDRTGVLSSQDTGEELRDVLRAGGFTWLSTFRSAQLFRADLPQARSSAGPFLSVTNPSLILTPAVAWRTHGNGNDVVMVHQRHALTNVRVGQGGGVDGGAGGAYGGGGPGSTCDNGSVVQTGVTVFNGAAGGQGAVVANFALPDAVLPVDSALSPNGLELAVASPARGFVFRVALAAQGPNPCGPPVQQQLALGEVIGLGYLDDQVLVAHRRNPAAVLRIGPDGSVISALLRPLDQVRNSRAHALFHTATRAMLACASCHPEGRDDGHTWLLDDKKRRTQSLTGGLSATAPFHWAGEHADLGHVLADTFVGRMGGAAPASQDVQRLGAWLDSLPSPRPMAAYLGASAGRAVFERAGCGSCHAGAHFTQAGPAFVGTSESLQVPSLLGVGRRGPWMHDGCAKTMLDRFDPACGGSAHGNVAGLSAQERSDLAAYLQSL